MAKVSPSGKEILISLHDDIFKNVDRENNRIEVVAPEGLLEPYLS